MQDMVQEFQVDHVMTSALKVVMVDPRGKDEPGMDTGGVYRDAIACFWQEFYDACTLDKRERVPTLRHDFKSAEWTAVARILAKGYLDLGYFPCMLSQAFIISVMFGEDKVPEDILLQSLKKYIAKNEEEVISEALEGNVGDCTDASELLDVLDRLGCRKLPTRENVRSLILEVAHKEIVQKAQYVPDSWRDLLQMSLKRRKEVASIVGLCNI